MLRAGPLFDGRTAQLLYAAPASLVRYTIRPFGRQRRYTKRLTITRHTSILGLSGSREAAVVRGVRVGSIPAIQWTPIASTGARQLARASVSTRREDRSTPLSIWERIPHAFPTGEQRDGDIRSENSLTEKRVAFVNRWLVAEWLACWTQAQKAWVQIAVATLSGNSLRQTVHTHYLPSSKISSSPLKGCRSNCRPGGK